MHGDDRGGASGRGGGRAGGAGGTGGGRLRPDSPGLDTGRGGVAAPGSGPPRRRRLVLAGGLGLLAVAGLGGGFRVFSGRGGETGPLEEIPGLPGFLRAGGGAVSRRGDFLIGIAPPEGPAAPGPQEIAADPCAALFSPPPPPGVVPIAFFTDYNCPYCRVMTGILARLEADPGAGVRIYRHELAILGAASEMAARGALAARAQGAYDAFHRRLMRSRFLADANYMRALAEGMGLDAGRLLADMTTPETEAELARTKALARLLGINATPGLVVGRIVVVGEISPARLAALIEHERGAPPPQACSGG